MSKRVLVIDDDAAVRRAFELALYAEPYDVVCAATGEEGVALATTRDYDLVYLDLRMPGIDGVETLRRIRAVKPDVPVYIATAFHREFLERLAQARHQGLAFELLRKPLGRQQIIAITRALLGDDLIAQPAVALK